jgi:hypothetical protein
MYVCISLNKIMLNSLDFEHVSRRWEVHWSNMVALTGELLRRLGVEGMLAFFYKWMSCGVCFSEGPGAKSRDRILFCFSWISSRCSGSIGAFGNLLRYRSTLDETSVVPPHKATRRGQTIC